MTPASSGAVRKTMRPGEKGTARFVRDWGEQLVCVRYRFDENGKTRYTTVEIVAAEPRPWNPPKRPTPDALVYLRVDRNDWKAIRKLREARVWWDRERRLWRTRYDVAERLRLRNRIVTPERGMSPTTTHAQVPSYAHRQVATNRNLSENPRRSS